MRTLALLVALSLCQGCIAAGAISGAIIGTLAPIGVAAGATDPNAKAAPETIVICALVGAGIGTLIGILAVEDNKPKKEDPNDRRHELGHRGEGSGEGRDAEDGEESPPEED